MKSHLSFTFNIITILVLMIENPGLAAEIKLEWKRLAPIPDSLGLGGAFAGTSDGALIVAGGSNFPDKMPWEGGTKAWHDNAYVLENGSREWRKGFKSPLPSGYGVSASTAKGLVIAGGSDATRHLTNVYLLGWKNDSLEASELPALPFPLAYSCGGTIGNSVFVFGGTTSPTATSARDDLLRLDLDDLSKGWQTLPPCPGLPRMLSVAAVLKGGLYVAGGCALDADSQGIPKRTYLRDAYKFTPGQGWIRLADMPKPAAAAPTPAPVFENSFYVIGGDDGTLVNFEPKAKHPGFHKRVMRYDTANDRWTEESEAPVSRATLSTAAWNGYQVLVSGEVKPGVRSPEVWAVMAEKPKLRSPKASKVESGGANE